MGGRDSLSALVRKLHDKHEPLYVWRKRVEEGGPQNLRVVGRPEMLRSDPEAANG